MCCPLYALLRALAFLMAGFLKVTIEQWASDTEGGNLKRLEKNLS